MKLTTEAMLSRLGAGESIQSVCAAAEITRLAFDEWWTAECRSRVPATSGKIAVSGPGGSVSIERDAWGVPRIKARTDADLFFGYGYAVAQDRLFQLDYTRRKPQGRLAEILGPSAVESDLCYRTLDLAGIADRLWAELPQETRELLIAYTAGVNAVIDQSRDNLPIEFSLLDYQPEPWQPTDCLVIEGEFRWYLTGRFPVIVIPELAKRVLGDGDLYRAFLRGEEDRESILPPGSYAGTSVTEGVGATGGVGATISDREDGRGSNNWVLSGERTTSGKPQVASDPHVMLAAVSIWHEVILEGGSFHVGGVALAGMPAIMIGRSQQVAWGITNNICSLRDLYQEQTDPAHPGCYLYDGHWEPARERTEVVEVRGAEPVSKVIRSSRNGPIVDDLLPLPARHTGPVSLRWQGQSPCGWLTALLAMNRADSCATFREAMRPWCAPTFNVVYGDVHGRTGMQTTGRIPVRKVAERGYRPGWELQHQWDGAIPFEGLPHLDTPPSGYVVTANNRLAPDDYPYPLSGTWSSGYRARRIREEIEARPVMTVDDSLQLQRNIKSGRAEADVPLLVTLLQSETDDRIREAIQYLADWDCRVQADSVAATLFNLFFKHWCRTVTAERFPAELLDFVAPNANGLATRLLAEDDLGWFHQRDREEAIRGALVSALDDLTQRFGPEMSEWTWGRLHVVHPKHFLSGRGDLGQLLDGARVPVPGDTTTVCNLSPDDAYAAYLGGDYRMVADLSDPDCGLHVVEMSSQSGHPGSPHYNDQFSLWLNGTFRSFPLKAQADATATVLHLRPKESSC